MFGNTFYLKASATEITCERFVTCMCSAMSDQIWSLTKCFSTHYTFMRFFTWKKIGIKQFTFCYMHMIFSMFYCFAVPPFWNTYYHQICQKIPKTEVSGSTILNPSLSTTLQQLRLIWLSRWLLWRVDVRKPNKWLSASQVVLWFFPKPLWLSRPMLPEPNIPKLYDKPGIGSRRRDSKVSEGIVEGIGNYCTF